MTSKKPKKRAEELLTSGQVCRKLGIAQYQTLYRIVAHGVAQGCLQPYYREGLVRRRLYLTHRDLAIVRRAVAWRRQGYLWAASVDRARRRKRVPEQLDLY